MDKHFKKFDLTTTVPVTYSNSTGPAIGPIAEAQEGLGEREAFERQERSSNLQRKYGISSDDYENPYVQSAWEGWQARASLPVKQAVVGRVTLSDVEKLSECVTVAEEVTASLASIRARLTKLDGAQDAAEQPAPMRGISAAEQAMAESYTPAQPDPVAAQVERAMIGEAQRIMAERYPAPVAGDVGGIDGPAEKENHDV